MSARISQALLSVSDKRGVVEFARALAAAGVALLSTGGTAKALADAGLAVTDIGSYTGFPEMLDGRVKTLHPEGARRHPRPARRRVAHADARRAWRSRRSTSSSSTCIHSAKRSRAQDCTLDEAIENIDIGGPAMVRSAAKNWRDVGVVVDPADYARLADELARARRAFRRARASGWRRRRSRIRRRTTARSATGCRCATPTATSQRVPAVAALAGRESAGRCATARIRTSAPRSTATQAPAAGTIAGYRQLQGKELSYNNIADSDAAWECVKTFDEPACVIVKHANPCGVAIGDDAA